MRGHAGAQDAARLERARAEGKASFYANITAVQPIIEAFGAGTGVKGESTRISTSKSVATAITEVDAGKLMADVVQAPLPVFELLKDKGVLAATARRPRPATRRGRARTTASSPSASSTSRSSTTRSA